MDDITGAIQRKAKRLINEQEMIQSDPTACPQNERVNQSAIPAGNSSQLLVPIWCVLILDKISQHGHKMWYVNLTPNGGFSSSVWIKKEEFKKNGCDSP